MNFKPSPSCKPKLSAKKKIVRLSPPKSRIPCEDSPSGGDTEAVKRPQHTSTETKTKPADAATDTQRRTIGDKPVGKKTHKSLPEHRTGAERLRQVRSPKSEAKSLETSKEDRHSSSNKERPTKIFMEADTQGKNNLEAKQRAVMTSNSRESSQKPAFLQCRLARAFDEARQQLKQEVEKERGQNGVGNGKSILSAAMSKLIFLSVLQNISRG